ncbi:conserved Plasmodium protein, unknown function [Plasmodium ovale curtisi]|uniref:Uncharacterized protein n=1 Tax=Plasmodium ovale curtisi TaxID=864141 RepID=A0A1A8W2E8_PLAOA|nr:conserved Plasmodium protein, unknown function [Plasmodium ovale curtisi]
MTILRYSRCINFVRKEQNTYFAYLGSRRDVSYDTLAGIPWMSHSRITNVFERVSNEGPYDKITWEKLSERAIKICKSFSVKEIGRILYACSKVKYRNIKIIYKFTEKIKKKEIEKVDFLACAHICHALNSLNYMDKNLYESLLSRILKLQISDNSFSVIITLNAYAKHCNDDYFRELAFDLLIFSLKHFDIYKKSCSPQGLSMLLNSFSQVVKPSPSFLKKEDDEMEKICIDRRKREFEKNSIFRQCGNIINISHENSSSDGTWRDSTTGKNYQGGMSDEFLKVEPKRSNEQYCIKLIDRKRKKEEDEEREIESSISSYIYNESEMMEMEKSMMNRRRKDVQEDTSYEEDAMRNAEKPFEDIIDRRKSRKILREYFLTLLLQITKCIEKMNTQSLSLIINACCRIPFDVPEEFLKIISEEIDRKIPYATIRHLSLIVNGFVKLNIRNEIYMSNIFNEIEKKLHSCDEQQLHFILNSMVKLNYRNDNLLHKLSAKFMLKIRKMNISTMCNVMYNYAKLNIFNGDMFQLYQMYFKKIIHTGELHHLALSSYVFAKYHVINSITHFILNKTEDILKKEKIIMTIQIMKDILILVNSFSQLDIYSDVLAYHLFYIINVNKEKLKWNDTDNNLHEGSDILYQVESLQKMETNTYILNADMMAKMLYSKWERTKSSASEVTASEVTASEVTASEVTASEVTASEVTASEVTASEVTASEVTASEVTASEVTASEVTASEVIASEVTASEVTASEVTASEVIASEVTASEVTASKVTVATERERKKKGTSFKNGDNAAVLRMEGCDELYMCLMLPPLDSSSSRFFIQVFFLHSITLFKYG